jgi:small-conductance mechanosensitive channel
LHPFEPIGRLLAVLMIGIAVWAAAAPKEGLAQAASPLVAEQNAAIEALARRVDTVAAGIDQATTDDARLADYRIELQGLLEEVLQTALRFRPRLSEINARLEQLGPAPEPGNQPEPELVSEERRALLAEKAEINALLGKAEALSIRANGLTDRIAELRRANFTNTLSKRYDITFAISSDVAGEFAAEAEEFYETFASWLRFVARFKLSSALAAAFLALSAAAVLLIGGRRLFGDLIRADAAKADPSYLSRLSVAFWSTLLPSLSFAVFLGATYYFFDYFRVLRPDVSQILWRLFVVSAIVFFVHRLAAAALSPRLPNWRLIPVSSNAARTLLWLTTLTAIVTGLDFFLGTVSEVLGSTLQLTVAKSLIATVLVGLLVILIGRVRPFEDEKGLSRPWPSLLRYGLFVLGGATILAALLGYIGFARFVSQQIVVTGAIIATMYIGMLSARAIAEEGAFAHTALGRRFRERFGVDETMLDQVALALSVVINLLVILCGVPLILLQWGFQIGDIQSWAYRLATGVTIGTITISLVGILTGVLVFLLGLFLTRWFQTWLDGTVMTRGRVDAGVRNSIRTGVGYAGVALAGLVGLSAAGIDLSNLALVAGALSLGIGFGLQNIVSNFVSGLILLVERPFKAGDWVVAGSVAGTVKKISVRATEIETFQKQTVILPNSELINAAVGNWTHKNKLGRVEIPIGVAYGSDARRVHDILLEIVQKHPMVLKNPEPFVYFVGFGASSLDFEVRFFLPDILNQLRVQNDIRFAILDAFAAEGIEIPFPQQDLHLRSLPAATLAAVSGDPGKGMTSVQQTASERSAARRRKRQGP